mmetsp:Transcript_4679/g.6783  ORF Transcript_4679/g.6783 Transcript_4679/m.6783 type:complete len:85 (+) Transcript_4679:175-429(+)
MPTIYRLVRFLPKSSHFPSIQTSRLSSRARHDIRRLRAFSTILKKDSYQGSDTEPQWSFLELTVSSAFVMFTTGALIAVDNDEP